MDILTINDTPGTHAPSWYAATTTPAGPYPTLSQDIRADVCVVGGGFTGLSSALHLAKRGYDVVLIEASRVGSGASGRNGGQVGTGQRLLQPDLEPIVGQNAARTLWDMGLEATALVRDLASQGDIDCLYRPGILHADHKKRFTSHSRDYVEHMQRAYAYDKIQFLDQAAMSEEVGAPSFVSGVLDLGGGHIHPLRYATTLAKLAEAAGVRIFETTRMTDLVHGAPAKVVTSGGTVTASHVLLGLNGYHNNADATLASRVMPINNFITVTEPLGEDLAKSLIKNDYAVADSRFVVNYFRLSHDHRMIFGGGESYGYQFPRDLKAKVSKLMSEVYPQLANTRIDFAWGGTLGITMSRLPHFERLAGNVLSASGFSGHGIAMASLAGKMLAEATAGQAERFDLMSELPTARFPGGALMRTPLLATAMIWYALRDRI